MIGSAKVLWTEATAEEADGGFGVALDGRPVKTPARAPLVVPTRALAQGIADEWAAQTDQVKPETMPMTRMANAAIDKLSLQFDETVDALAQYAGTDLVCFRADAPEGLVARQTETWGGLLTWLRDTHDLLLVSTVGVIPIPQPEPTLAAFRDWIADRSSFALMGLHDLIVLSGSAVIARAVAEDALTASAAWDVATLDEAWQREVWGADEEADAALAVKAEAFHGAAKFLELLKDAENG